MSTTTDPGTNTRTSTPEQIAAVKRLSEKTTMNYYEVLGLTHKTATANDIRISHRKFSLLTHSDKNDPSIRREADIAFTRVQEAYNNLSDPGKREAYDAGLQKQTTAFSTQLPPNAHTCVFNFSTGDIQVSSNARHSIKVTRRRTTNGTLSCTVQTARNTRKRKIPTTVQRTTRENRGAQKGASAFTTRQRSAPSTLLGRIENSLWGLLSGKPT
ncbi:hypothetical protein O988_09413 [Pseudogymnoascus sp. VKM F-3808]|nr:hypothetical protein O988_09413 [Pseudogymnoascus sp. VKM F-3808]